MVKINHFGIHALLIVEVFIEICFNHVTIVVKS